MRLQWVCAIGLLALSGCGSGIEYEHDGLKIGDAATAKMLEGAKMTNDGYPYAQVEAKSLPLYHSTTVQMHEKRIEDIWFAFDKSSVKDVYALNEEKYGKPSKSHSGGGQNPDVWIWTLKDGGRFELHSDGWGRATSRKMLALKKRL